MRSIDRRAWLASLPALLAAVRTAAAQSQRPSSGAAGPLRNPDWVGRPRDIVDSADNAAAVSGIEHRLRCTCGCGLDVFTCRTTDFTCTYSPALHKEVVELLARGRTPDQVVEAFVAKYGETVLMAPKDRGFGVLGYWLPGGVLAVAGAILAWVLVRRSRHRAGATAPVVPPPTAPASIAGGPDLTPEELARLDRALRDLER